MKKTIAKLMTGIMFGLQLINPLIALDRYVAFSVNNHHKARPQRGLNKAKVTFEYPVEGGLTRLLAFYDQKKLNDTKIGPIRSVRQVTCDLVKGYDSLLFHLGQDVALDCVNENLNRRASGAKLVEYDSNYVDNLDMLFKPLVKSDDGKIILKSGKYKNGSLIHTDLYFRTKTRKVPHNAYFNGNLEKLLNDFKEKGYSLETDVGFGFNFKDLGKSENKNKRVDLEQTKNHYVVSYVHDNKNNNYVKYINGIKQVDETTGLNVAYDDVIIQLCNKPSYKKDFKHVDVHLNNKEKIEYRYPYNNKVQKGIFEENRVMYLIDGEVKKGTWKREKGRFNYYDENGNEMIFNKGNVMVHLLPNYVMDKNRIKVDNKIYRIKK